MCDCSSIHLQKIFFLRSIACLASSLHGLLASCAQPLMEGHGGPVAILPPLSHPSAAPKAADKDRPSCYHPHKIAAR